MIILTISIRSTLKFEDEIILSKWLESCGISHYFGCVLQKVAKINEEHQEWYKEEDIYWRLFHQGKIPLSLNDHKWSEVHEILTNLPQTIQDVPSKIEEETQTINDLEEQIKYLQDKLKIHQSMKCTLEEQLEGWKKNKEEVPEFTETSSKLKNIEESLSDEVITQLDDSIEDLSSLCDSSDKTTLSLVLNACGLSSDTILKLSHMDGYDFLRCRIEGEYSYSYFSSFGEFKDLVYCHEMLKEHHPFKTIPYNNPENEDHHFYACPICYYDADNLYELLKGEYHIEIDEELFKSHNITGSRLLMMTMKDFTGPLFNMTQQKVKYL